MTIQVQHALRQAHAILPVTRDDLLLRGIAAEATDRIVALRKSERRLQAQHGSPEELERAIKATGVSPDDHTLYTDLLEWRALRHEMGGLLRLLETL